MADDPSRFRIWYEGGVSESTERGAADPAGHSYPWEHYSVRPEKQGITKFKLWFTSGTLFDRRERMYRVIVHS